MTTPADLAAVVARVRHSLEVGDFLPWRDVSALLDAIEAAGLTREPERAPACDACYGTLTVNGEPCCFCTPGPLQQRNFAPTEPPAPTLIDAIEGLTRAVNRLAYGPGAEAECRVPPTTAEGEKR